MTTHFHDPLTAAEASDISEINERLGTLDAAIYDVSIAAGSFVVAELGEDVGDRNAAYLNLADNKIYLMDTDAAGPKVGAIRGFIDGTGLEGEIGTLVISGILNGFSGLTPYAIIYASATGGNISQTKPFPILGGSQLFVAEMGFATAEDTIYIRPKPIQFLIRDAMALNETMTLLHHADERPYQRIPTAYLVETEAGAVITDYASSNQDSSVALEGASGAGGPLPLPASGSPNRIGDTSGVERYQSQSFLIVDAGILSQFTFELDPNSGSPTGNLTWEIRNDNAGDPGTLLASGSHTPTANATNTVTVTGSNKIFLAAAQYWLVLYAPAQASNVGYVWQAQGSSSYANGVSKFSTDSGSTWSANAGDCQMSITTQALTTGSKLAQTFNLAGTETIAGIGLWLRNLGSPTGTMTIRIETVSASNPTGTLAHANAVATLHEGTITTSYAEHLATFADSFSLAAGDYAIVISTSRASSVLNYVLWGADGSSPGYSGGSMRTYAGSWADASKDAVFAVYEEIILHPSLIALDWWSSTHADIVNRYGDGAGADLETQTTFKCLKADGFDDVTLVVTL